MNWRDDTRPRTVLRQQNRHRDRALRCHGTALGAAENRSGGDGASPALRSGPRGGGCLGQAACPLRASRPAEKGRDGGACPGRAEPPALHRAGPGRRPPSPRRQAGSGPGEGAPGPRPPQLGLTGLPGRVQHSTSTTSPRAPRCGPPVRREKPETSATTARRGPATKWRPAPPRRRRAELRPLRPCGAVCPRGAAVAAAAAAFPLLGPVPGASGARPRCPGARPPRRHAGRRRRAPPPLRRLRPPSRRPPARRPRRWVSEPARPRPSRPGPSRRSAPSPSSGAGRPLRGTAPVAARGGGARPAAPCPCRDPPAPLQGQAAAAA